MNTQQLVLLNQFLDTASLLNLPIWIGGGWAIDARLGRITREHDDIDLTFPGDRRTELMRMIEQFRGGVTGETSYGLLASVNGILVDCEPAYWNGSRYEVEGAPDGGCPDLFEGVLDGRPVRCNSWDAILWDYFYYARETPSSQWPDKHHHSFELATEAIGEATVERLRSKFLALNP